MEQQIDWNKLLEEMERMLKTVKTENQTQETQTQTQPQSQTQEQNNNTLSNEEKEFIGDYINYNIQTGRQLFISKYNSMPNFSKYFSIIDTHAYTNFMKDLAEKGQVKGTYDVYLEEALRNFLYELYSASKDLTSVASSFMTQQEAKLQASQKPYTIQDYYDDYKKALEKITLKNVAHIRYEDGSKHRGYWGEPQLELDKSVGLDDI